MTEEEVEKEEVEEMDDIPEGNVHEQMADVTIPLTDWLVMRDSDGNKVKYLIKYHRMPWEKHMRLSTEAWGQANGDKAMYVFLLQIAEMKEIIDSIQGMECKRTFWLNARADFVEAIRQSLFGDSPLMPKEEAEQIKNLLTVLSQLENPGANTKNRNDSDRRTIQTDPLPTGSSNGPPQK